MTKEEARKILGKMILGMVYKNELTQETEISLPIIDFNLPSIIEPEPKIATTIQKQDELNDRPITIESYSFRGLIKFIYDLEESNV